MPDQPVPTPPADAPSPDIQPPAAPSGDPTPPPADTLGDAGKHALDAERKARREAEKQAKDLAAKVAAFEAERMTETEKLQKQLADAQKEAADAKSAALRSQVIAETGLPADLHEFLVGADEADLRAKADKLKAALVPSKPGPDPAQGPKAGPQAPSQLTRDDLSRMSPQEIEKAFQEGRTASLLGHR